jgi:hypothetical protein
MACCRMIKIGSVHGGVVRRETLLDHDSYQHRGLILVNVLLFVWLVRLMRLRQGY